MAQCEGTTKAGSRCRRQARAGSSFCASHEAKGAQNPAAEETTARRQKHPLADAAVVGMVAIGLLVLRRVIRLLGS